VFSEEHLHDIFISLDYYEILKHKEHFLKCSECFNKLLNAYYHYFACNFFFIDHTKKDLILKSFQDPKIKLIIEDAFKEGGKVLFDEESFIPRINTGSLFVSFCENANYTKSVNSVLINGEIGFPEKGPLKELTMLFLKGFSNIKHIVMYNKHKLFNIKGKSDFYQRYFKELCCAFSQEETRENGFVTYLQGEQNIERVILFTKKKMIGDVK